MIGGHVTEAEEQAGGGGKKGCLSQGTGKKGASFLLSTSSAVEPDDHECTAAPLNPSRKY